MHSRFYRNIALLILNTPFLAKEHLDFGDLSCILETNYILTCDLSCSPKWKLMLCFHTMIEFYSRYSATLGIITAVLLGYWGCVGSNTDKHFSFVHHQLQSWADHMKAGLVRAIVHLLKWLELLNQVVINR